MDVAITKMSSKGQIVIPAEMREDLHEGDKLIIIKNGVQFILKKASEMEKQFTEDLEFARRTEEALTRYERGEFKEMTKEEFEKELEEW
ncbi:MAG: AbrB/MazE/SpoVT family DNA-binding domain-containing protein [Methanopyri archaeon]|jgi:AbrB family looped-hinge helix DNA binding protein|nr:AbrB/MazE/SpoVT family DNA-binding domain-containing protein [Methanopyri archaeon]